MLSFGYLEHWDSRYIHEKDKYQRKTEFYHSHRQVYVLFFFVKPVSTARLYNSQ